jgi:hypothetical protein
MPTPSICDIEKLSLTLQLFQSGEDDLPQSFWIEFQSLVLRIARTALGTAVASDAYQDVASEVILGICSRAPKPFEPDQAKLTTYLFNLVRTSATKSRRDARKTCPGPRVDLSLVQESIGDPNAMTDVVDRSLLVRGLISVGRIRFGSAYADALKAMLDGCDQSEAATLAQLDRHKLHRLNLRFVRSVNTLDWAL